MKDYVSQIDQKIFSSHACSLIKILIASLLICALCIPYVGIDAHAASAARTNDIGYGEYFANEGQIYFNTTYNYDFSSVYATDENSEFSSVTSDNPKVATVSAIENKGNTDANTRTFFTVYPKNAGSTYITMTDVNGQTTKLLVTVTKGYFKKNFKNSTNVYMTYGKTYNTIYTKPYAKVRLTLAGRTTTKKANKYGEAVFKINKIYKIGQKYYVKVYWHKLKLSYKEKILSSKPYAYTNTYWSCKYNVPYNFISLTNGDRVTLYIGNEKHLFVAPYTTGTYQYTFYTNYKMSHYSSMKIVIENKYKQHLYTQTFDIHWN